MKMFHATYLVHLHDILLFGLGGKSDIESNWEFSKPGVTCLASYAELALSFAEGAELAPDSPIIILEVETEGLSLDEDYQVCGSDAGDSFECREVIHPSRIKVLNYEAIRC